MPHPDLAREPLAPWVKPTHANTAGGSTYQPTHPGLFGVEFNAMSAFSQDAQPVDGETYASRLVVLRVSIIFATGNILILTTVVGHPSLLVRIAPGEPHTSSRQGLLDRAVWPWARGPP
jgi:hypothetical protein